MDNAVASGVTAQMAKHNRALKERISELEQELQALRAATGLNFDWVEIDGERVYTSYDERLRAENKALREAIQNVLDGNYPHALKHEKCKHGFYGYIECGQCVDDYLQAALDKE